MITLVGLCYSPWTEKARWALDFYDVPYREESYTPILGEPALRLRVRRLRGPLSVPIALTGGRVIDDSLEIARHASGGASGSGLFPAEHLSEILAWNARSEVYLRSARPLVTNRILSDPRAKEEALPRYVPAAVRTLMRPVATIAGRYFRRKYGFSEAQSTTYHATCLEELAKLRDRLSAAGGMYLCGGRLTYADVTMAVTLQTVEPVSERYLRVPSRIRTAFTDPFLRKEFPQLIQWRDRLYEDHRRTRNTAS